MVEDKFNRLITYFEETKTELENNNLSSPLIKSKWIYYPNEENEFIYKVEFLTNLNVVSRIKSAQIQIIGDTFAKLYINGEVIDSVYTKRSGSLWIEQQRVKLIDITKHLTEGENKITVEARNYYDKKTPGINIIGEIITETGKQIFMSGENWLVRKTDTEEALPVEVKENTLEIIAPNFTTKRKSRIER